MEQIEFILSMIGITLISYLTIKDMKLQEENSKLKRDKLVYKSVLYTQTKDKE